MSGQGSLQASAPYATLALSAAAALSEFEAIASCLARAALIDACCGGSSSQAGPEGSCGTLASFRARFSAFLLEGGFEVGTD